MVARGGHLHCKHFAGAEEGKFHGCPYPFVQPVPGSVCPQDTGVWGTDAPGGIRGPWKPPWRWRKQPRRALCVTAVIFFSQLFPLLKVWDKFSLSLMQDRNVPKIRNKRQRVEGVEILKHSRSNNWSKNSHFLHEGRKEENEASVSARFYLLNLCLFSIWDNMAIQSLFLTSRSGYQARPPQ